MAAPTDIPIHSARRPGAHRPSLSGTLADPRLLPATVAAPAPPFGHYRRTSISLLASDAYAAATSPLDAGSGSPVRRAPSLSSTQSASTFSTASSTAAADDLDPFALPPSSSPQKPFVGPTPVSAPRVASTFAPVSLGRRESINFGRRFSASSWLGLGGGATTAPDVMPAEPPTSVAHSLPMDVPDMDARLWNGPLDTAVSEHAPAPPSELPAPTGPHRSSEGRARAHSRSNSFQIRRPSPRGERFLMGQLDMH